MSASFVPTSPRLRVLDLAIRAGRFARVATNIDPAEATAVFDGRGLVAFPGVVDAHQHWGIYTPLDEDAHTESRAAAQGGVTTAISYVRTGQHYLNKSGPYRELLPEFRAAAHGQAFADYGLHVAPILPEHLDEIDVLAGELASFKIFMFYGGPDCTAGLTSKAGSS